jgi:hypothetical protein
VLVDRGCEIKLLLDEDLSPWVALRLRKDHFVDAVHVRDRGRLGLTDREVLEFAFGQDRILVTGNVLDFVRLAKAREMHCGIVFVLDRLLQRPLFRCPHSRPQRARSPPDVCSCDATPGRPLDDGASGRRRVALRARGGDGACPIRGREAPRVGSTHEPLVAPGARLLHRRNAIEVRQRG